MKYFVVMMFLFMTSGVFVAKDNNVCIKILDVDGIRLKGVDTKQEKDDRLVQLMKMEMLILLYLQ